MSFQADFTTVLKAEIGPSASLFFKKCMLQLGKDPRCITPNDLEEIAEWAYEEIRSMIDDKTAFRVRHQIIQIPTNAREMKRPFHSPPSEKTEETIPVAESQEVPVPRDPPQSPSVPEQHDNGVPEPGTPLNITDLLSNLKERRTTSSDPKAALDTEPAHDTLNPPAAEQSPGPGKIQFSLSPDKPFMGVTDEPVRVPDEDVADTHESTDTGDSAGSGPESLPETIARFQSMLETDGENPELWKDIAELYMRSGKFRDATLAWQRVVELGVETPAIWYFLGDAYKKLGQYEDSDLAYARSLELNPDDPEVWLKQAKVQVSRNRYDDALASCDESLTLDQSSVPAWHYKAFVLRKTGRNEEALEIYVYLSSIDNHDENAARQVTAIRKILGQ